MGSFLLVKWVPRVGGGGLGGEPKFTGQRVARRTDGGANPELRESEVRNPDERMMEKSQRGREAELAHVVPARAQRFRRLLRH